jgi:hypothetical protein
MTMVTFHSEQERQKFQEWAARCASDLTARNDVILAFIVALPDGRIAIAHNGEQGSLEAIADGMKAWLAGDYEKLKLEFTKPS